ncbi:MAG: hypothetical protein CVU81_01240 [Euryarchaeota archaeon HGW-Euryarchaeota-1]|nr:MAG: hypothetical protein CVU81_01240 [Euryarchaeota archaeon HGW-Euryarchaeota-1]
MLFILEFLQEQVKAFEIKEIAEQTGIQNPTVSRAILGLIKNGLAEEKEIESLELSEKGEQYAKKPLPEQQMLMELKTLKDVPFADFKAKTKLDSSEFIAALGYLKRRGIFQIGDKILLLTNIDVVPTQRYLQNMLDKKRLSEEDLAEGKQLDEESEKILLQRGILWRAIHKKIFLTKKGKEIKSKEISEETTFDINAPVAQISASRRHPYNEVATLVRKIFLEMGFQEMEGPLVETTFWCMDSMFIPQDHPARDVQDTYFVGKKGMLPNKSLVEKVKEIQETGGDTGSTGYQFPWKEELADDLILRTHSTATTFRTLYFKQLKNVEKCKYFYIARSFRNETTDATHLCEFAQAEGFIMADGLTLADLKGFIKEFYAKLGVTKIRFKPVYNPYTEPSMQAYYYDEKLKKWSALINSGIFRPEALAPYGITKPIIAWGIGFNRLVALLTKTSDVRDTLGPICDLNWLSNREIIKRGLE